MVEAEIKLLWGADAGFHLALAWALASCPVPQFPDLRTFLVDHAFCTWQVQGQWFANASRGEESRPAGASGVRLRLSSARRNGCPPMGLPIPVSCSVNVERAWAQEALPALSTALPTFPCASGHFPLSR